MKTTTTNSRMTYCGDITKAVFFTTQDLTQNAAHNLATTGLGQVLNHKDSLGSSEGSDGLADLHVQILAHLVTALVTFLEGDEGVDSLTSQLIGDTHNGSLGNHG